MKWPIVVPPGALRRVGLVLAGVFLGALVEFQVLDPALGELLQGVLRRFESFSSSPALVPLLDPMFSMVVE